VDGRDDNENLAIVAAVDHTNPEVHVVAALRGRGNTTVRELLAAR
jgi:voltage-gated potassium channel